MSDPTASFVHRFVPGTPGAPTLLLLHGTGGTEDDLLPLGARLAPGAALLSPRGPVLEHGMPRFFRRFAEGVFDVEDVTRRAHDLAAFVRASLAAHAREAAPVWAVGFSNGANIAVALMLLEPDVLRGAVLFRAQLPLEPSASPRLDGAPVLLAAGTADPLIPRAETERLAAVLRTAGARVDVEWAPAGHQLTPTDLTHARRWLDEQLRAAGGAPEA